LNKMMPPKYAKAILCDKHLDEPAREVVDGDLLPAVVDSKLLYKKKKYIKRRRKKAGSVA